MGRPLPPPKVLSPGANRVEVRSELAREVSRIYGHHLDAVGEIDPAHLQFMLDQADVYIQALLNLGVLKRAD